MRFVGVESGGLVSNLPAVEMTSPDGTTFITGPVEGVVDERQEALLATAGIIVGMARRNSSDVVFFSGRSLYRPKRRDTTAATVDEHLLGRLPLMFAAARIALHLQCMARDRQSVEGLDDWLQGHADGRPLAAARVRVEEGASGGCTAELSIVPFYQLEGQTTVSFRLWLAT